MQEGLLLHERRQAPQDSRMAAPCVDRSRANPGLVGRVPNRERRTGNRTQVRLRRAGHRRRQGPELTRRKNAAGNAGRTDWARVSPFLAVPGCKPRQRKGFAAGHRPSWERWPRRGRAVTPPLWPTLRVAHTTGHHLDRIAAWVDSRARRHEGLCVADIVGGGAANRLQVCW